MSNPFKRTFQLVQHTPLIHFQHDQAGATLRATEVKPKLDRFLLELISAEEKKKWRITDEQEALDYKMNIRLLNPQQVKVLPSKKEYKPGRWNFNFPMFLADMNKEDPPNYAVMGQRLEVVIQTFHTELLLKIDFYMALFFATHNFGMRSSKGYGSFYLDPQQANPANEGVAYVSPQEVLKTAKSLQLNFTVPAGDAIKALKKLEWFYKLLRSGINIPDRHKEYEKHGNDIVIHRNSRIYCKPVIFFFAKANGEQWDKRSIKEALFKNNNKSNPVYPTDKQNRTNPDYKELESLIDRNMNNKPIQVKESSLRNQEEYYEKDEHSALHGHKDLRRSKLLYRDLFGLSSEQEWGSYDFTLEKTHKGFKEETIDRIPSPLTFKLFKEGAMFRVFVLATKLDDKLKGAEFEISKFEKSKKKTRSGSLKLSFPSDFSWNAFFDFLKNKNQFDLDNAFIKGKNQDEYTILKNIVDQIQKPENDA